MNAVDSRRSSGPMREERASDGRGVTWVVAITVFVISYFFFPLASSHWTDRGPRILVDTVIAGMAAGFIHLIMGMKKRSRRIAAPERVDRAIERALAPFSPLDRRWFDPRVGGSIRETCAVLVEDQVRQEFQDLALIESQKPELFAPKTLGEEQITSLMDYLATSPLNPFREDRQRRNQSACRTSASPSGLV